MSRRFSWVLLLAVFSGCTTVGPQYKRPEMPVPPAVYGQNEADQAASIADLPWWEVFQDAVLRSLIEEALQNGFDARLSLARVEEARARYGISRASTYPQVDYQAGFSRGRAQGVTASAWVANVGVSWEVDLWGRIRRLNEAARAAYLATEEARHEVTLLLVAEVASSYFELRELDEELEIARRAQASFQDTFDLFKTRLSGGTASALETARAEVSLANVSAGIPLIQRAIVAQENRISLLLGRMPGPIPRGATLNDQPIPPQIPAGLPAKLLLRRPDLRREEQLLIAANANIGVAKAAFYPTISLTGLLGGRSSDLTDLVSAGKVWNLGAGVVGPIFQGKRLKNQYQVALSQFQQEKILYEQAVTSALGEVSTALVTLEKLAEAEQQRVRSVTAVQDAVRLVELRYNSGLSAYFEVLDALQQLLVAQTNLAATRRDRLVAMVQLYQALGGGWQLDEAQAGSLELPTAGPLNIPTTKRSGSDGEDPISPP